MPKAFLIGEDEKQFLYKKVENFVIIKFQVYLKEGKAYNPEQNDMCFGFLMKTSSLRAKKEPFEMIVPMFVNIGKLKRPQPPPSA